MPVKQSLRGFKHNGSQGRKADEHQHAQRSQQRKPLPQTTRVLPWHGLHPCGRGQAALYSRIGTGNAAREQQHPHRQNACLLQSQLMRYQLVNLHFNRAIRLPTQNQRQPKARKAIQKNQTQSRSQPRPHGRPLNPPKSAPRRSSQTTRRCQALLAHLLQGIYARAHQQAQVKKQIAIKQQCRRVFQIHPPAQQNPTPKAARPPQSQHPHSRYQRRHHKRQHQQPQHPAPPCKLPPRQHPSHRHTQHQRQHAGNSSLRKRPHQLAAQIRLLPQRPDRSRAISSAIAIGSSKLPPFPQQPRHGGNCHR